MSTADAIEFLGEVTVGDSYLAFSPEAEKCIRQALVQAFEMNSTCYFHRIQKI